MLKYAFLWSVSVSAPVTFNVTGTIDAKTKNGYMVSVKLGTETISGEIIMRIILTLQIQLSHPVLLCPMTPMIRAQVDEEREKEEGRKIVTILSLLRVVTIFILLTSIVS